MSFHSTEKRCKCEYLALYRISIWRYLKNHIDYRQKKVRWLQYRSFSEIMALHEALLVIKVDAYIACNRDILCDPELLSVSTSAGNVPQLKRIFTRRLIT
jgi:hypothetical protein